MDATAGETGRPTQDIAATVRQLRNASTRRYVGGLLNFRDWPTYVWLALVAVIVVGVPYQFFKMRERAQRSEMVLGAIVETSPLYSKILETMERDPLVSLKGAPISDVESLDPPDYKGFEILVDARIVDLRAMTKTNKGTSRLSMHNQLRVRRVEEGSDNKHFRWQRVLSGPDVTLVCRNTRLKPTMSRLKKPGGSYLWQIDLDFSRVPIGQDVDVITDALLHPDVASQTTDSGRFDITVPAEAGLVTIWVLMPEDRRYDSFTIGKYALNDPDSTEEVIPAVMAELPLGSLITFELVQPDAKYRYECRWRWLE